MTDHHVHQHHCIIASLHPSASSHQHHPPFFNFKPKELVRVKDAWRFTFNTRMGLHKVSATTEEAKPIKACLTCLPYLAGKLVKMGSVSPDFHGSLLVRKNHGKCVLNAIFFRMNFYIKHHKVHVGCCEYTSSSRASRWRKFQKKKELYSKERICL